MVKAEEQVMLTGIFDTTESWISERTTHYSRPEIAPTDPMNAKKGKSPGVLPGTAIDDYINLPLFIPCRRIVPRIYFANEKRSELVYSPFVNY